MTARVWAVVPDGVRLADGAGWPGHSPGGGGGGSREAPSWRRRSRRGTVAPEVEVAVLLDLLDAACAAGSSIPAALASVGEAAGGLRGAALTHAAGALGLGAPWHEAWTDAGALAPVRDALRPAWVDGVAPGGTLRAVAGMLRRERRARAMEAAGRLGVRLVVPLAVCHLPAFVLVGLVPVLISMAAAGAR